MFASTLLLSSALFAQSVLAQTYTGCTSTLGLPAFSLPVLPQTSLAACRAACSGFNFVFWAPQLSGGCVCSGVGASARDQQTSTEAACTGYQIYDYATTFKNQQCATSVVRDSRDSSAPSSTTLATPDQCFSQCAKYQYALLLPGTGLFSSYTCQCANYPPTISGITATCARGTYFTFSHTAGQAASGLARRRIIEARIAEQVRLDQNPHCPPGLRACLVSENMADGYECLRVESELESCGGCRYGDFMPHLNANGTIGVDCTTLDGVTRHGVTCDDGQCSAFRCKKGYRLVRGTCV